jgi:hypothetical protein
MRKYLAVLPAYNEEKSIGGVIAEVKKDIPFAEILVVDDGSTDNTDSVANDRQAKLIRHPFNLGYGAALQTGFRFAAKEGYDFVVTMDADGQHMASSVRNLIDTMEEKKADVVIGSRFLNGNYRIDLFKKIGIRLFSFIARRYTGIRFTDPTSGFQLLNRKAYSYLAAGDNYPLDYPDVNIIMALHKKKFSVVETPVTMRENRYGKSMHSGLKPVLYVIKMCLAIVMVLVRRVGR